MINLPSDWGILSCLTAGDWPCSADTGDYCRGWCNMNFTIVEHRGRKKENLLYMFVTILHVSLKVIHFISYLAFSQVWRYRYWRLEIHRKYQDDFKKYLKTDESESLQLWIMNLLLTLMIIIVRCWCYVHNMTTLSTKRVVTQAEESQWVVSVTAPSHSQR